MTTLFAQAAPTSTDLAAWLSVLMYLGGFVCTVLGGAVALKKLREPAQQPVALQQPLIVTPHEKLVTKETHEALADKLDKELGRERASRKGLYEKTEDLGNRLTRVEEKTDSQTLKLNTMDQKMDQVLMRLPRNP